MKELARRIIAALFFFLLAGIGSRYSLADESSDLTVYVHYYRSDHKYEGYSLWLWTDNQAGAQYDFSDEEDENGVVTVVTLSGIDEDSQVGILIKLNDWEDKDIEEDRYLDLSKMQDGVLDIYLQSGNEQILYSEEEALQKEYVQWAKWDSMTQISFSLCSEQMTDLEEEAVSLVTEDGQECELQVKDVVSADGNLTGTVLLSEQMQMYTGYLFSVEGMAPVYVTAGDVFDTVEFEDTCTYTGDDLGVVIEEEQVVFRVWAPTASSVSVRIYPDGDSGEMEAELPMTAGENGVWKAEGEAALVGKYYTYYVTVYGESGETIDPYAKSAGVNGQRGMILDLSKTDPEGFSDDTMPETESATDDVIYEISVRDFTVSDTSGVTNKGKYLGLAETGTVNEYGDSTGLDYLRELGIAYIQLMPTMDFEGIDEENGEGYNWGYNPLSYFVPEGSYATDAKNGEVRIAEYKEMVQALHENGIRVVLDVVYTHTYTYSDSSLNILVPGYYYRFTKDGSLSDGSGCGNETATERAMMRKLIVDSVCYWAEEYHVDGFRFDLMGLIDTETMEAVRIALDEINPEILVYGEGWTGGTSSYEGETASSANASSLLGVSFFNNVYRRGIQAYICGDAGDDGEYVNWVKFGIIGAVYYEELYDTLGYWTSSPDQSIQYSTCHDGYTLYDLIRQNCSNESEDNWIKRNQLASAMVLTGEGIPLFQSGEEFLRSKPGSDGNYYSDSYNAGDEVNALDWNQRTENSDLVEYYREWIAIRKMNDAFGLDSAEAVQEKLSFLDSDGELVIGYDIALRKNLLFIRHTVVIYNAGEETGSVSFYGKTLEAEPLSVAVYTETRADLSACALAAVAGILLLLAVVILIRRGRKRKSILRERVGE